MKLIAFINIQLMLDVNETLVLEFHSPDIITPRWQWRTYHVELVCVMDLHYVIGWNWHLKWPIFIFYFFFNEIKSTKLEYFLFMFCSFCLSISWILNLSL